MLSCVVFWTLCRACGKKCRILSLRLRLIYQIGRNKNRIIQFMIDNFHDWIHHRSTKSSPSPSSARLGSRPFALASMKRATGLRPNQRKTRHLHKKSSYIFKMFNRSDPSWSPLQKFCAKRFLMTQFPFSSSITGLSTELFNFMISCFFALFSCSLFA